MAKSPPRLTLAAGWSSFLGPNVRRAARAGGRTKVLQRSLHTVQYPTTRVKMTGRGGAQNLIFSFLVRPACAGPVIDGGAGGARSAWELGMASERF